MYFLPYLLINSKCIFTLLFKNKNKVSNFRKRTKVLSPKSLSVMQQV